MVEEAIFTNTNMILLFSMSFKNVSK